MLFSFLKFLGRWNLFKLNFNSRCWRNEVSDLNSRNWWRMSVIGRTLIWRTLFSLCYWNIDLVVLLKTFNWHSGFIDLLEKTFLFLFGFIFSNFNLSISDNFNMFNLRFNISYRLDFFNVVFINGRTFVILRLGSNCGDISRLSKILLDFLHSISFWFYLINVRQGNFITSIQISLSFFSIFWHKLFLVPADWTWTLRMRALMGCSLSLEVARKAIANMLIIRGSYLLLTTVKSLINCFLNRRKAHFRLITFWSWSSVFHV